MRRTAIMDIACTLSSRLRLSIIFLKERKSSTARIWLNTNSLSAAAFSFWHTLTNSSGEMPISDRKPSSSELTMSQNSPWIVVYSNLFSSSLSKTMHCLSMNSITGTDHSGDLRKPTMLRVRARRSPATCQKARRSSERSAAQRRLRTCHRATRRARPWSCA